MASDALNSSYHGIAARLDRLPITGFHKKILWLLAGITFCDSVDMAVGGPIGNVLQSEGWMTLEQFAFFNSITMVGYLFGGLMAGALSDGIGRKRLFSSAVLSSPHSASSLQAPPMQRS